MNNSTSALKGCTSVTALCIVLAVLSSLSIIVTVQGNEVSGTHSLLLQSRLGRSNINVGHQPETIKNNPPGINVNRVSNRADEIPQRHDNNDGRVKRASNSGYVRFGKRFSPLIEGHQSNIQNDINNAPEPMYYDDERVASGPDEAMFPRQQRAPDSSYVRFGKRGAPAGMSYSGCVAYTLARARNRSDLLRLLVENGCVKDKRLFHYAKKDGYIRFGK